jgi:hypothetical protein
MVPLSAHSRAACSLSLYRLSYQSSLECTNIALSLIKVQNEFCFCSGSLMALSMRELCDVEYKLFYKLNNFGVSRKL